MKSIRKQLEKEFNERNNSISKNIMIFTFLLVLFTILLSTITLFEDITRFELVIMAHIAMVDIGVIFILLNKLDNYATMCMIICLIGLLLTNNSVSNYLVEIGSFLLVIFSIGFILFDLKKETRRVKKC